MRRRLHRPGNCALRSVATTKRPMVARSVLLLGSGKLCKVDSLEFPFCLANCLLVAAAKWTAQHGTVTYKAA